MWPGKGRNVEGQNIGQHYRRKEILREKKYGCNNMTETYEERKKERNVEESEE